MNYPVLALILVGLSWVPWLFAWRRLDPRDRIRAIVASAVTVVVLSVLTAVFDNIMIAAGLFSYDLEGTAGILIGSAPLEDFSYAVACAIGLPGLWIAMRPASGMGGEER